MLERSSPPLGPSHLLLNRGDPPLALSLRCSLLLCVVLLRMSTPSAPATSTLIPLKDASSLPSLPASDLPAPIPPAHIGPVSGSSELKDSYEPAVLARSTLEKAKAVGLDDELDHAEQHPASSSNARRRFSEEDEEEDDGEAWDDWDASGGGEHHALDQEIRELEREDGGQGGGREAGEVLAGWEDRKLKQHLYWRHVLVTGIFVVLW